MVFFQYWVTFFSTIFIVYFYINIFYLYGTSEWFMLQFLNSLSVNNTFADTNAARLLIMIFILSVFFKLGITPFHLFKIEVYKGLPFLSIFFYTTYYFVVFFIFFIFLLSDLLCFFIVQCFLFLGIVLLIGCIYTSVLLFDVSFIKAFFTYSTIINTIGFLLVFIVNLQ
jgi:NADH:ubiquinone oxidoreductase subunit 2 (subunit N)